MAARVGVGTAFWIPSDRGFALGVMSHKDPTYGALVWIADKCFEDPPTLEDVETVGWRWCVFFPLGPAAARRIVEVIGKIEVPAAIRTFPALRAGGMKGMDPRWVVYERRDLSKTTRPATPADMHLNIEQLVNDTRLIEMITSDWRPEDRV